MNFEEKKKLNIQLKLFFVVFSVNPAIEINNLAAETAERKEVKYIKIKSIEARMSQVEKIILRLDNIFPGNKEISK